MDDQKKSPKTFDVSPPSASNSQAVTTAPKTIIKNDPMLTNNKNEPGIVQRTQPRLVNPPTNENSDAADIISKEDASKEQPMVNTKPKIEPINQDVAPEVTEVAKAEVTEEPEAEKLEDYVSTDGLPDKNDKKTADIADGMHEPRIYDTKEYFVPIHETTHSHGFVKGSIVAGALAVVAVLGTVAFLAFSVSK